MPEIKSKYFRTGECVGIGQTTVYISPCHWDLECQGLMIPGTPDGGTRSFVGILESRCEADF